jgi:acid phosphatase family membrane protein YuiD
MENFEIVVIPLIVGMITQTTKFVVFSIRHGINWNYFLTHGHMPSMHSALVSSLVVVVGYLEGINTGVFAISVVFALIILDDALRIRMHLGDQGRYLNMMIQALNLDRKKYPRLKERVGHRWSEVIVGILFGVVLTFLFIYVFKEVWIVNF